MERSEKIAKLVQASPFLAAIGQHKSFTKAAETLNIHQSAVSHRTKALEDALGLTLFERTTRQIKLTPAGEILCAAAASTLSTWETALNTLDRNQRSDITQISLSSSLAVKWLIPALPRARELNLDISLEVNEAPVDFTANEADAAIRFGRGPYPGLFSVLLTPCWLQPVASPAYLAKNLINDPFSISDEITYLSDRRGDIDKTDFSWLHYFSQTKNPMQTFRADIHFDRADLMLQAAISGMGICLGRTLLIENDIEAGFLSPIGPPVRLKPGYWLVCTASFAQTDRFKQLHRWLDSEVKSITEGKLPA